MDPTTQRLIIGASGAKPSREYHIILSTSTSPYVRAFKWLEGASTVTEIASPSTPPGGSTRGIVMHPSGQAVCVPSTNLRTLNVYAYSQNGFGSLYSEPTGMPTSGTIYYPVFTPGGQDLIVLGGATGQPSTHAWPFSVSTGFGTKYTSPSSPTGSPGNYYAPCFSPNGDKYFRNLFSSPYFNGMDYTPGTGFGTVYSNPASLTTGEPFGMTCNGSSLVVASIESPGLHAWPVTGGGFGTRFTSATGGGRWCRFSPNGQYLWTSSGTRVRRYAWNDSTGFGTSSTGSGSFSGFHATTAPASDGNDWLFTGASDDIQVIKVNLNAGTYITSAITLDTGLSAQGLWGYGVAVTYFDP